MPARGRVLSPTCCVLCPASPECYNPRNAGPLAQWQSRCLLSTRLQVRVLHGPPDPRKRLLPQPTNSVRYSVPPPTRGVASNPAKEAFPPVVIHLPAHARLRLVVDRPGDLPPGRQSVSDRPLLGGACGD